MALGKRSAAVAFLLTLMALCEVSLSAVHKVGDSAGWTTIGNIDYNKWASNKNFHVGDSLVFEYNNQFHNVKQVSHQVYQSCNATSAVATYTTGSDSITLKRAGHYYFLCGLPGHCQAGQKVNIMVTPASLRPSASPLHSPSGPSPSVTMGPASLHNTAASSLCSSSFLVPLSLLFALFVTREV